MEKDKELLTAEQDESEAAKKGVEKTQESKECERANDGEDRGYSCIDRLRPGAD